MATYDSEKVRKIATQIRQLADGLENEVTPRIRGAREAVDLLSGRTAEAMEQGLTELRRRADDIAREYAMLARLANTYADRLEEVDQELAERL